MKLSIAFLLITLSLLQAHDLWIDEAMTLHLGHLHSDHVHGEAKTLTEDQIASTRCEGKNDAFTCKVFMAMLKPVYYTKTPYGTKHLSKDKLTHVLHSKQVFSSAKRIFDAAHYAPLNEGFEIALAAPFEHSQPGDKLRLIIMKEGKPLKGAAVAYEERFIGVSDTQGRVNVKIRHGGLQQIKATFEHQGDGIHADTLLYESHLNLWIAP